MLLEIRIVLEFHMLLGEFFESFAKVVHDEDEENIEITDENNSNEE